MSEEVVEEITHPGPILRAARDELKMSVEQVANALHLRPSVVLLIESESYDDFSGDVFLKGYFRSYCRIVGLHEERMVELLEAQLARLKAEKEELYKEKMEATTKAKRVHFLKLISLVSIVCALGLGAIWLLASSSPKIDEPESMDANVERQHSMTKVEELGESESLDQSESPTDSEAELTVENDDSEIAINLGVKSVASELMSEAEADSTGTNLNSASESSGIDVVSGSLVLRFSDECWIEAYDAAGARIIAGLKKPGSEYRYQGALPIRVVLGNGRSAEALFNDELFELAPFTKRSGRAEIVFN